jgi:ABC-type phosphate transport system permease subunit/ABC-type phosphate transport system auxiliary subunit
MRPATTRPVNARVTPMSARGEPMVWLMGLSLVLCLVLIIGLLGKVLVEGSRTFWPRPIQLLTLNDGSKVLGVETRADRLEAGGRVVPRTLLRTGNRELGTPFVWVRSDEIKESTRPVDAMFVERSEWGPWIGVPEAVVRIQRVNIDESASVPAASETLLQTDTLNQPTRVRIERTIGEPSNGKREIIEKHFIAEGASATLAELSVQLPRAQSRQESLHILAKRDLGWINQQIEQLRQDVRQAEIDRQRTIDMARTGESIGLSWLLWGAMLVGIAGCTLAAWRTKAESKLGVIVRPFAIALALLLGVAGWVERPWLAGGTTQEQLDAIRAHAAAERTRLEGQYAKVLGEINTIQREDEQYRLIIREPNSGRFAPIRQSSPDDPMLISQVVRAVQPNQLSWLGKLGVYLSRWGEFLGGEPREANTEGGVFPVIFGTVVMTVLLSIAVVPLGVIAALYLREYAKQGFVTSAIRVAVNNLAGVPSIVYGVFGLGFFCYTLGQYIDGGPRAEHVLPRFSWWFTAGGVCLLMAGAVAIGSLLRTSRHRQGAALKWLPVIAAAMWVVAVGLIIRMLVGLPYFHGLYESKLPSPTYGGRGLLWGSLTLALLTLPVVIVATEEAIAAVPKTMREGSFGAGASKWQTIVRIVLPQALPGIMTGMILAMARGAGEVAPLMLVGAVKLAPDLPLSGHFPFLHPERSFMHLGFHIYDLGFQSPDSEAARPFVWTTTLLLIAIVLLLNLVAIIMRARLRARFTGTGL